MQTSPLVTPETAVAAVLTGCFLIFFGYGTYRATIVLYLAVIGAMIGSVIAQKVAAVHPLAWTLGGGLLGALVAVPVEAFMRVLLGVVSGGVFGLAAGSLVGGALHAAVGFGLGAAIGGALWVWMGDVFIMAMFALVGSVNALVGIHALAAHYGRPFEIGPLSVAGVLVSSVLGTAFQYILLRPPKGPVPEREGETFNEPRQQ